jgi:hypothetical protein
MVGKTTVVVAGVDAFGVAPYSLSQELPTVEPTRGRGSPRRWQPCMPAMAAGLTDHAWTTDELLSYRPPAPFIDQLDQLEQLFPELEEIYQGN